MISFSGRGPSGGRLACPWIVSVYELIEDGLCVSNSHDYDTQGAVHLADNVGVDVCSGASPTDQLRG